MTRRLRNWSQSSYSATDGRAASSLADELHKGSPSTMHAENISAQIPDARGEGGAPSFAQRDRACTQGRTPVSRRPL